MVNRSSVYVIDDNHYPWAARWAENPSPEDDVDYYGPNCYTPCKYNYFICVLLNFYIMIQRGLVLAVGNPFIFVIGFILIVYSFTCRPIHDMGPIFYLRTYAVRLVSKVLMCMTFCKSARTICKSACTIVKLHVLFVNGRHSIRTNTRPNSS